MDPEPDNFAILYCRAFAEYGTRALWNKRALDAPTPEDALVVARALRIEGERDARRWRNASSGRVMPLSRIQIEVLRLLASQPKP
jgi:hypothetical protein